MLVFTHLPGPFPALWTWTSSLTSLGLCVLSNDAGVLAAPPHWAGGGRSYECTVTVPGPGKDPANRGYPNFYVHLLPGSPPRTAPSSVPGESSSFSGLSQLESWVLPLETSVHTSASWLTRGRGLEPSPRPPPQQRSASPSPSSPGFPGAAPQHRGHGLPGTPTPPQGPSPLLGFRARTPRARDARAGRRRIQPQGIRGAS